jgi:hypothetical protein
VDLLPLFVSGIATALNHSVYFLSDVVDVGDGSYLRHHLVINFDIVVRVVIIVPGDLGLG